MFPVKLPETKSVVLCSNEEGSPSSEGLPSFYQYIFSGLDIVVEVEFVRMRTERDGIHLILLLVVDPGLD